MSDVVEAIRAAGALIFGGIILLVFAQGLADTTLDTGTIELGVLGVIALIGGGLIIVVAIAVVLSQLLAHQ